MTSLGRSQAKGSDDELLLPTTFLSFFFFCLFDFCFEKVDDGVRFRDDEQSSYGIYKDYTIRVKYTVMILNARGGGEWPAG